MSSPTRIDHLAVGDVIVGRDHRYRVVAVRDRGAELDLLLDVLGSVKQMKVHLPAGLRLPVEPARGN